MQLTQILFIVLAVAVGAVISFIIRKLIFEKSYVPTSDLNIVKDQLQELKTQKAVVDNELTACREEKDKQSGQIENKDRELEKWRTDFTKADTEREGLILDIIEKNLEINNLNQKIEVDLLALQAANNKANRLEAELAFKEK